MNYINFVLSQWADTHITTNLLIKIENILYNGVKNE
jgi:hypothetical protein